MFMCVCLLVELVCPFLLSQYIFLLRLTRTQVRINKITCIQNRKLNNKYYIFIKRHFMKNCLLPIPKPLEMVGLKNNKSISFVWIIDAISRIP